MYRLSQAALLLSLVLMALPALARKGDPPPSWQLEAQRSLAPLEAESFPAIDAARLRQKDAEEEPKVAGTPTRFAVPYRSAINPARDGEWEHLPGVGSLWRYAVEVPGATDINLGFSSFNLPRGATLHLWSDEKERYYQGPYTARDNKPHGELWTPVLPGERVVIELFVPEAAPGRALLELGQVGAGYRDFFGREGGPYPRNQGSCNIDVVCPEGDDWRDQIRSVAVYQRSGTWTCTGSLVNDVSQSLTPYFLTANHCGITDSNASSMVVYWNFESPNCGDLSGGSLDDNQSGASLVASRTDVDMALVELDEIPDEEFEVYYTGWDRSDDQPGGAVGIHHPRTAEKAISFAYSDLLTTESCIGGGGTPDTHWEVPFWDEGTTEPGSSGSGIWNPNNSRLIGFLSGGTASCTNLTGYDCYGKFVVAWDGSSADSRLKDWLDPSNVEPDGIDGTDPTGFQIIPDAASLSVCLPGDAVFELDILPSGDFEESVTLSAVNLPAGASASFSQDEVTPPAQSTLTVSGLTAGTHSFTVLGESVDEGIDRELSLKMVVTDGIPGDTSITEPAHGSMDVSTSPLFEWADSDQAAQYELEVATDSGFGDVVYSTITEETTHRVQASLSPDSLHYARVRAVNACGDGAWSTTSQLTTALEICVSPNLGIPDNDSAGVTSSTTIESDIAIESMTVAVDITHTWVGDLIVDLEHVASGTNVRLFNRPGVDSGGGFGCSGEDIDVIFDDEAGLDIQAECSSDGQAYQSGEHYQPYEPLAGFEGLSLEGEWEMKVSDHAGADIGTLVEWCIIPVSSDADPVINVIASPVDGGEVDGGGTYEQDEEVTVTAEPADGYVFESWTENDDVVSTSSTYTFTAAGNRTLTANFEQLEMILSAASVVGLAGEDLMIEVQIASASGEPQGAQVELCLEAEHLDGGAVEIEAGDLAGPADGPGASVCGSTDGDGYGSFFVSTTTSGAVELIATSDLLGDSEPLEVTFEPAPADGLVLVAADHEGLACEDVSAEVHLLDAFGNWVVGPAATEVEVVISVSASSGTPTIVETDLGSATSNGDDTVTGTMPSDGHASITVTLDAVGALDLHASSDEVQDADTLTIEFDAGEVDASSSEISTDASVVFAGDGEVQVVVTPRDTCGAAIGSGLDVTVEASFGDLSEVQDVGDGTYTSIFSTSEGDCPEEAAKITAEVDGVLLDDVAEVLALCLDAGSPVSIVDDRDSVEACASWDVFSILEVVPLTSDGNAAPEGLDVRIVENAPFVVAGNVWEETDADSGETSYMLEVGSNRCSEGEPVSIEVLVGGVPLDTRPEIEFTCPEVEEGGVTFIAESAEVPADGETAASVRVKVTDRCDNPAFGRDVELEVDGELSVDLSDDLVTTADALNEDEDGTAAVELSSTEPGFVGLIAQLDGLAHQSEDDLVEFVAVEDDEEDDDPDASGCGCAAGADGTSGSSAALLMLGLVAFVLRPRRCRS